MNKALPGRQKSSVRDHSEILALCLRVRVLVEKWTDGNDAIDRINLCGACAIASFALWRVLRKRGVDAKLVCVGTAFESHCWVEIERLSYDLTATQFDMGAAEVEVRPATVMAKKFRGKRYEDKKAVAYISTWGSQSPLMYRSKISSLVYRTKGEMT